MTIRVLPIVQYLGNQNDIGQSVSVSRIYSRIQYIANISMVGSRCCRIAPKTLKTSPASHITRKDSDNPSPERLRKFSIICGEKTTSQHAMDMLPVIPDIVSADN
jgi:hypothetical protein